MVRNSLNILFLMALMMGCDTNEPRPDPPLAPVLKPGAQTIDSVYNLETGISSAGNGNGIVIRWDQQNVFNVANYTLYRTAQTIQNIPVNFIPIAKFPSTSSINFNEYVDRNTEISSLSRDSVYFYRMTALDESDLESIFSNIVSYQLIQKPQIRSPQQSEIVDSLNPVFSWYVTNMLQFVIFVRRVENNELVWLTVTNPPDGYGDIEQSLIFGEESTDYHIATLVKIELEPNTSYEWRVFHTQIVNGDDPDQLYLFNELSHPRGSFSEWTLFQTTDP